MQTDARQRILRATAATLSWTAQASNGETGGDPGVVTVGVTNSAGDTVIAAGTATAGTGVAARTVALTPSQTAALDLLTATWKVSTVTVAVTYHDIVGGFYFTASEAIGQQPSMVNADMQTILSARNEVESAFESWTNMAFVPRFDTYQLRLDGQCRFAAPHPFLRAVRWCRLWGSNTTYTDLTAIEAAAIRPSESGFVELPTTVCARVEIGFEHGLNACPFDVKSVAILYARHCANRAKSGVPDRAISMVSPDGASYQFGRIGTEWRPTGIEVIDEVLRRPEYDHRRIGVA